MRKPEVIVIGAGVVGCSIAFHLVRAGAAVRVIDKSGVCSGMTSRSGALLRMHYTFAPEAALAWKSLEYFRNWRDIVGGECGFVETGFALIVGHDNAERLKTNVAMMRSLGINASICTPAELSELDASVNTADIVLAAYEPKSGYADPVAATASLCAASLQRSATFSMGATATSVIVRGDKATGVQLAGGERLDAPAICIAAGPWTDGLLAPLGIRIGIRAERAQIALFECENATRHLAYIDTLAGCYFRPHGANLTLAGLGEWRPEPTADPDDFRQANDPEFVAEVQRRIAHRIPALSTAVYDRGHAGIYDVSPDSRAVLGPVPGIDGLYVAAGFSGTGFKTAPAVGAAIADLILKGKSENIDISAFGFERLLTGKLIESPNEYVMGASFGHKL